MLPGGGQGGFRRRRFQLVKFLLEGGGIGTAEGLYRKAPCSVDHEEQERHGGSGTPADQLSQAIENGIAKINIYSELTAAWNTAMRDFLNSREQMTCWFVVACKEPDAAMRQVMRSKMDMFKSTGKF